MRRRLRFTDEAAAQLDVLASEPGKKAVHKQVLKTLGLLEIDTRHPSLKTHEFQSLRGANGERVWEAYAQNNTPRAFRVFFHYGPDEGTDENRVAILTIVAITTHP